jgi:hypothetical protein
LELVPLPDFDKAFEYIKSLGTLVKVEKTYLCMQSIVVVSRVHKSHLAAAHTQAKAWVGVLSHALGSRKKFEKSHGEKEFNIHEQ